MRSSRGRLEKSKLEKSRYVPRLSILARHKDNILSTHDPEFEGIERDFRTLSRYSSRGKSAKAFEDRRGIKARYQIS
jgi:hypothetical protein